MSWIFAKFLFWLGTEVMNIRLSLPAAQRASIRNPLRIFLISWSLGTGRPRHLRYAEPFERRKRTRVFKRVTSLILSLTYRESISLPSFGPGMSRAGELLQLFQSMMTINGFIRPRCPILTQPHTRNVRSSPLRNWFTIALPWRFPAAAREVVGSARRE